MKNAKNYPVMKISKENFKKFEQQYMLDVIRDSTYRYGQAFMNYFIAPDKFKVVVFKDEDDVFALWYTSSREKAEYLINKNFEIK